MSLFKNFITVGGATASSRVLGFIRDMLIAALLGAGGLADAFFIAFQVANLARRLLADGGLLAIEVDSVRAPQALAHAVAARWAAAWVEPDLFGRPRYLFAMT